VSMAEVWHMNRDRPRPTTAAWIAIAGAVCGALAIAVFQIPFLARGQTNGGPGDASWVLFFGLAAALVLLAPQVLVVFLLASPRAERVGAVLGAVYAAVGIFLLVNWLAGGANLFGAPHDVDGLYLVSPAVAIGLIDAVAAVAGWLEAGARRPAAQGA
jgi:hypothetical protein